MPEWHINKDEEVVTSWFLRSLEGLKSTMKTNLNGLVQSISPTSEHVECRFMCENPNHL